MISKHKDIQEIDNKNIVPTTSMAMPSLVYRTNEITKRVIASNHENQNQKQEVPSKSYSSEEPEWMLKCMFSIR